jgi:CheY-like chemotaxis protein
MISFTPRSTRKKFEVDGNQVEACADGESGLAKVKEFAPDVILLDIMMPKLDGFEVLERLKADMSTKHIPVVMMTNLSTEEDKEKAQQKGAMLYIVKSDLTPAQVVTAIKETLGLGATKSAPAPAKAA